MTQERLITTSSQPGDIAHVNKKETFPSLKYECDFGHKHVYASLVNNIGCKFCPNYETSRSKCSRGKKKTKEPTFGKTTNGTFKHHSDKHIHHESSSY